MSEYFIRIISIGNLRRATAFITALALMFILASCEDMNTKIESNKNPSPSEANNTDVIDSVTDAKKSEAIGNFQYPENPSEELRNALKRDIDEHGLERLQRL